MDKEQTEPVRYRAADIEWLIMAHHAEYPRVPGWRMSEHRRADNYAWLIVDSPRGPVHRSLPRRWGDLEEPLGATPYDMEDGTARWVGLHWRACCSSHEWVYVPGEGWRDRSEDGSQYNTSELRLASTPLGVLEFMRDLDAGVVALGRPSDLDLVLAVG